MVAQPTMGQMAKGDDQPELSADLFNCLAPEPS
jgi:hypothetical protein